MRVRVRVSPNLREVVGDVVLVRRVVRGLCALGGGAQLGQQLEERRHLGEVWGRCGRD